MQAVGRERLLPPHHNPGVQIWQLCHAPGFGLETAPLGLQQVLYHKLVGPWQCEEEPASLCVLLAGSNGPLSPLWGAGTWQELAGSQIWPF